MNAPFSLSAAPLPGHQASPTGSSGGTVLRGATRPLSTTPSDDFPYASNYVEVLGSKMHYVDVGEGDPILFLHGNPTSSYLWRNVIPHVADQARCIAVDLIGMGESDKPDIGYRFDDHSRYLSAFIDAMGINKNLTLVIHDWGSILGLRWACENPDKVRAIAFMEAIVRPLSLEELPRSLRPMFRLWRSRMGGFFINQVMNIPVKRLLPNLTVADMSKEARAHYIAHHPTVASRKAIAQFLREVPIDGSPTDNLATMMAYRRWLAETDIPMLLFYGDEGTSIKAAELAWLRETITHLDVVDLGHAKHFVQEAHPQTIGSEISRWFAGL